MAVQVKISKPKDVVRRKVTIRGLKPIIFDRYPGDNTSKLQVHQKMYLEPDTAHIGLPTENIFSFLSAQNTRSAPKALRDIRKYKNICSAIMSFFEIEEDFVVFHRDGEPLVFKGFNDDDICPSSGAFVHRAIARLDKGVPNPKERPAIPADWSLTFNIRLYPNNVVDEQELANLISEGGVAVGLGTYRPRFGKFELIEWE